MTVLSDSFAEDITSLTLPHSSFTVNITQTNVTTIWSFGLERQGPICTC